MFGRSPRLNPLMLRKQLLLAESDLNRAQLVGDMAELKTDLRTLTERGKSFSSLATSAAALVAGLAAFQSGKASDTGAKPSWIRSALKGAGLISTVWLAFRSQKRGGNDA